MKPHDLAPHIPTLFRTVPEEGHIQIVRDVLDLAVTAMVANLAKEDQEAMPKAITDSGLLEVAHYLGRTAIFNKDSKPHLQAAGELTLMCVRAIERGEVIERDRQHMPLLLAAMAGFVPDRQSATAKNKRPGRRPALLDNISQVLKENPDATWKEVLEILAGPGENVVTYWDDGTVKFQDSDGNEKTISTGTFRRWITKSKNEARTD